MGETQEELKKIREEVYFNKRAVKRREMLEEAALNMGSLEIDPNGKSQHEAGAKLDAGKNRLGLVLGGFSKALTEVGKVGTFGAGKYSDDGWKDVKNGQSRYTDAMLRHWTAEADGEDSDIDSGMLHAAHTAWNALARLEFILIELEGGE